MILMQYSRQELRDILRRNQKFLLFEERKFIKENARKLHFAAVIEELGNIAEEAMEKRPYTPTLSEYRSFMEVGVAESYFVPYSERRMYLNAMVIMTIITEEDKYIRPIEDYIWAMINTYKWTSPRDHYFLEEKGRDGVPHEECLDLLATETAFTFAEIDAVLGDRLSGFIRKKMKEAALSRVIRSFANKAYYHWWEFCNHNWAAVCGCSVAGAAMYYLDDDEELIEILERVLKTMERFLAGYKADGVCVEGVSYWKYGFSYFVFFCELLRQRTNGEINLMLNEKVHQIALYLQRCRVSGNVTLNFGDSGKKLSYSVGLMHKLKSYFSDICVPPVKYASKLHEDRRYRWAGFIRDFAWFNEKLAQNEEDVLEKSHYFKESQVYISHKQDVCFAVAGGHNGYSHNHNDLGHFIYHVKGQDVFIDIGQGAYCKGYFTEKRYSFLNNSSAGHSLPMINGQVQQGGAEYSVRQMQVSQGETDTVGMDITGAYSCKELERLYRSFTFQNDGTLQICDSIEVNAHAVITESFVVSVTEEPIMEPGKIILHKHDAIACLEYGEAFHVSDIEQVTPANITGCNDRGMRIIRMTSEMEAGLGEFKFRIKSVKNTI